MKPWSSLHQNEFWRYLLVGFLLFIIDIVVVNFSMDLFQIYDGPLLIFINIIGVFAYSGPGYFLNKKYAFRRNGNYNFYLISLFIFAIADSLLFPFLASLPINTEHYVLHANGAKIISFIITGIGCYLLTKYWAFKKQEGSQD